jgi:hypothetical protein
MIFMKTKINRIFALIWGILNLFLLTLTIYIPYFIYTQGDEKSIYLLFLLILSAFAFFIQWVRLYSVTLFSDYFTIKRLFTKSVTYKYQEVNCKEAHEIHNNNLLPYTNVFIITHNKTTYTLSKNFYRNYDAFVKYFIQMKENASI